MHDSIRRAVAALTLGHDEQRQFDLAAAHIQRALLEFAIPPVDYAEIGIHTEPARLVGGDYLDLVVSQRSLIFGLGDASGKSLAAALHALSLRYLVRGLLRSVGEDDLSTVVSHTNAVVTADMQDDHFITFLLGSFDPRTRVLRTVNAGHEPPLLLRAASPRADVLYGHGLVLGIDGEHRYEHVDLVLEPGDLLTIYTDGLTEATNERGEAFTIDLVARFLVEARNRSAQDVADGLFDTVKAHAGGELRDDATVFVMRVR